MEVKSWEKMGFGPITGKRNPKLSLKDAEWQTLEEDTIFEGIAYAKGSRFKIFETEDFGHVVFSPGTLTPSGEVPAKLLHRQ